MLAFLKRALISVPVFALLSLATATNASADPGDGNSIARGPADAGVLALITDDDVFSMMDLSAALASPVSLGGGNGTQHYGPFAGESPDSGTCGVNDWANDTFEREFTVRATPTGFTVVEQFKRGAFTTIEGVSPGSCDSDDTPPGTIRADVTGSMHGYEVITVTGTQTNSNPSCGTNPCTTAGFLASHFAGSFAIGTFFFHYAAGDQGLLVHEWKNASDDRGGNHGDIQDEQVP